MCQSLSKVAFVCSVYIHIALLHSTNDQSWHYTAAYISAISVRMFVFLRWCVEMYRSTNFDFTKGFYSFCSLSSLNIDATTGTESVELLFQMRHDYLMLVCFDCQFVYLYVKRCINTSVNVNDVWICESECLLNQNIVFTLNKLPLRAWSTSLYYFVCFIVFVLLVFSLLNIYWIYMYIYFKINILECSNHVGILRI